MRNRPGCQRHTSGREGGRENGAAGRGAPGWGGTGTGTGTGTRTPPAPRSARPGT